MPTDVDKMASATNSNHSLFANWWPQQNISQNHGLSSAPRATIHGSVVVFATQQKVARRSEAFGRHSFARHLARVVAGVGLQLSQLRG